MTQAVFTDTTRGSVFAPVAGEDIAILYALRCGLDDFCTALHRSEAASESLDAALLQLSAIDDEIMSRTPRSLAELRLKMLVCRAYNSDGDFCQEHIETLFAGIEELAG